MHHRAAWVPTVGQSWFLPSTNSLSAQVTSQLWRFGRKTAVLLFSGRTFALCTSPPGVLVLPTLQLRESLPSRRCSTSTTPAQPRLLEPCSLAALFLPGFTGSSPKQRKNPRQMSHQKYWGWGALPHPPIPGTSGLSTPSSTDREQHTRVRTVQQASWAGRSLVFLMVC